MSLLTPTPVPTSSRSRWPIFLALLLIAAVFLIVAFTKGRGRRVAASAEPPEVELAPVAVAPAAHAAPLDDAADPTLDTPIIDEIRVEHQEICEGEENLITVKAHTPAGRGDAFLHYVVGSTAGQAVPLRGVAPPPPGSSPGPLMVQVFGRGNAHVSAPVPPYTVKDCRADRALLLRTRQMPNSTDEVELAAAVRELGPSAPLRVTSYRWSFGDGDQTVTTGPAVVHRFAPRNPNALYSEHLVRCEAVGADGRSVVGRTAVSLRNAEFENLEFHKTLVLSVEFTPRFPERNGQGHVVQTVRLYHHRDAPVRLESARVAHVASLEAETPGEEGDVAELLGTAEVPPGHGLVRTLRLDTKAHPDARMVNYHFEGHVAGVAAMADFSIMVPPAPPTPETGTRVGDPLLAKRIMRARERLGKAYVNDEDLLQLEREGAFEDLKAPPAMAEGDEVPPAPLSPELLRAAVAEKTRGAPVTR